MAAIWTDEYLRTQRSVAREYHRGGYDVVVQSRGDILPPFLRGFAPDLIVMRDDDCAVVEIKTAENLRGSNEINELAAAVDQRSGWRFELIALGPSPHDVVVPSETPLDRLTERALGFV